jgi:hypothetical protein
LALVDLTGGTFSARSHGPHPSPVARAVIKKINDILALEPQPDFLTVPPTPGRNRRRPRCALILWLWVDLGLVDHVSLVATCISIRGGLNHRCSQ